MLEVQRVGRRALTIGVILSTVLWSMMAALLVAPMKASAAGCTSGTLIKGASFSAVYYCGSDGKRYVFTNDKNYFTWYSDFSGIQTLPDAELGAITIGGNATYRPGVKMIKIQSDPKVYAIAHGGILRPVASEAVAACLYGSAWNQNIDDISDAFFVNYSVGAAINACTDYDKTAELNSSATLNANLSLGGQVGQGGVPTVSSVTPSNSSTNVSASANLTATFSAAMDAATLNGTTFTLTKSGSGSAMVGGTVTYSGNTATLNPSADLEVGASYTATVTTGAKSQAGTALSGNYSWNFTVGATGSGSGGDLAPTVTTISPPDGGTDVAVNAEISATFSEAMTASTLNAASFILMKGSVGVAGNVSYANNKAIFTPSVTLQGNTVYTAKITSAAKDLGGTALAGGDFTWSFTTTQAD